MTPLDEVPIRDSTETRTNASGPQVQTPGRHDAENAIRLLLRWIGEDPTREGLRETPQRVIRAFEEQFGGYREDPGELLEKTFEKVEGYNDIIVLNDIPFSSHCEHHMVPITGTVSVGYLPDQRLVGISKLARVVDGFARRLQIQEAFTRQIAACIETRLAPRGVAVVVHGQHHCMAHRGVRKSGITMSTRCFLGCMKEQEFEDRFYRLISG